LKSEAIAAFFTVGFLREVFQVREFVRERAIFEEMLAKAAVEELSCKGLGKRCSAVPWFGFADVVVDLSKSILIWLTDALV